MIPDLENAADVEIVPDNIHAVQAIYAAYLLEEARLFQVVERIAELFGQGLLPLGRGRAAEELARFARAGDRLSERERASLYSRVLGAAGGSAESAEPNREFLSLWMRFVASVAMFARQREVEDLLSSPAGVGVSQERVRRAARALAANASAVGGQVSAAAAQRLAADVRRLFEILGDRELQQAFGARDAWQVIEQLIEQVSARELGGARNTARYRTLSEAGSRILGWLADHADAPSPAKEAAPAEPDADLVDAVEQWLAASGVSDDAVEELSQPGESPTLVSPPIALPSIVRDLLGALGLEFGGGESSAPKLDGLAAWFQGAPRTGKTLAAHVLATALGRDVVRIDLAAVASQYIGETEKNLEALFEEAERAGAVLLIDDADALFGQRSAVKDAHDRFANLDVARLMERIAAYKGLVIVATNRADGSVDEGVLERWRRRARVVRFPRTGG
jgi:hypothetical protein